MQVRISAPAITSNTAAVNDISNLDYSQLQVITDLCSIIQNPCHPCIGLCVDNQGQLRGTYNAEHELKYVDGGISLEDILQKHPGDLGLKERYDLSITLISSLLQLSHTPWLQESWNKSDIVFFRAHNGGSKAKLGVDVKHPYLTREHQQTTPLIHRSIDEVTDSSRILALGIMLLEICSGLPIEHHLKDEDRGCNDQYTEISHLQAVHRLLQEHENDFSWAFSEAISYCLQCFMKPRASLSDHVFSKTIENNVLAPLENERTTLLYGPA